MSEESQQPDEETAAGDAAIAEREATGPFEDAGVDGAHEHGLWPVDRLLPLVEALLFAAADPLPARKIVDIVEGSTVEEVRATLEELSTQLLTHGFRLIEVAGGWQLRTAPEHQRYVRKLFRERPQRLTRAATETVAVVAYRQPVTRAEVETVRGVDCGGVLESLVERRLVKVVGRKDVPGRPLVYATSKEFLELFGLRSLRDLPTLPELGSDIERMSEQSGFGESEQARILPLEDDDDAQSTRPERQTGQNAPDEDEQRAGESAQERQHGQREDDFARQRDDASEEASHKRDDASEDAAAQDGDASEEPAAQESDDGDVTDATEE